MLRSFPTFAHSLSIKTLITMPGGVKSDPGVAQPPPTGTLLLRDISNLATQNDALGEIKDAAVFVRANVIEWVGLTADLPEDKQTADQVISLKGCVAIPGRSKCRSRRALPLKAFRVAIIGTT